LFGRLLGAGEGSFRTPIGCPESALRHSFLDWQRPDAHRGLPRLAHSCNYLLYGMANHELRRLDPRGARGLDGTIAYDWSPANINRNNTMLTAGLRFNEPLPLRIHNTMSLGYAQNRLSQQFVPKGAQPWKPEHGVEFNTLLDPLPMLLQQPVVQYYTNVGAKNRSRCRLWIQNKDRTLEPTARKSVVGWKEEMALRRKRWDTQIGVRNRTFRLNCPSKGEMR
jgi:hypothetical protein